MPLKPRSSLMKEEVLMLRMMVKMRFSDFRGWRMAGVAALALAAAPLSGCSTSTQTPSIPTATTFSGTDANVASTIAAFRTAIGGVNNGGVASPQSGGRREINWDAVTMSQSDFNSTGALVNPHTLVIASG